MVTSALRKFSRIAPVAISASLLALAAPSLADVIGPGMAITVHTSDGQTAVYSYDVTWNEDHTIASFEDSTPYIMYDGLDRAVAILNPAGSSVFCSATYVADPIVALNFSVINLMPTTSTFAVASALLSFPTLANPQGRASAAFSVTDGDGNGATLTGIGDPNGAQGGYLAQYNGFAGAVAGTTFAELHPTVTAVPNGTATTSGNNVPPVGFNNIAGNVSDMSSLISFELSGNDLASATTIFEIVPEPASLGLLLLGVAVLRRRA